MAVLRQANLLGNQRVDIPHLRSIESGVAGDVDLLAGVMLAGQAPLITSGFYILSTGITIATSLKIRVAGSALIHFLASESGSIFHVPTDRPDEQLNTVNPRVIGGFAPNTINYVGLDFVREADDSTVDLVEFIDSDSELETPVQAPLARTLDYRIIISTLDFDNNPGVAPIAKISVDIDGNITDLTDARCFMFRLGSGGTVPNVKNSYAWPAGRLENTVGDTFVGGDKAIGDFKNWMDAVMSRLWEVGGGEYWYSPTTYANERLARTGSPFVSNGEYFEWDGTNIHWQGLVWIFANSTSVTNIVANQTTNQSGLTDLADGECIYVDVHREANTTVNAVKGSLATLGTSDVPGSRYVLAWRYGSSIYTRDQSYAVNSTFKLATIAAAGTVQLSASDATPFVTTCNTTFFFAQAAGLSRSNDFIGGAGDITIGGWDTTDHNVVLKTIRPQDEVKVRGFNNYTVNGTAPLSVLNTDPFDADIENLTARFVGHNNGTAQDEDAHHFEAGGAIGYRNVLFPPQTPAPTGLRPIRQKTFFRDNGIASPNKRDQFCVMWSDGTVDVIYESPTY